MGDSRLVSIPTWVPVVAAALRDPAGRVLLQERPAGKHHGGMWELPGGKVETIENPRLALVREIAEELGIQIQTGDLTPLGFADEGGESTIVLFLYNCRRWQGEVQALEGQKWGWFTLAEAARLPLAPMDADLLRRISD